MDNLNLTSWAAEPEKPSIAVSIGRMNEQRGSFRDLTEQELEEDILREAADGDAASDENDEDSALKRRQELNESRNRIIQGLSQAAREAAAARDLVSLILTTEPERRPKVSMTMSEVTRNITGLGVLGKELVSTKIDPDSIDQKISAKHEVLKQQDMAFGLKLKTLNSSANTILAAAQRLEEEMKKEAQYWEDLSKLKSSGWTMTRQPRDARALGVRLNSLEAAPEYRDKGFVKITRDEDGRAELNLAGELAQGRRLRVEIRSQGKIVAASTESLSSPDAMNDDSLHATLNQARDALYDEELFHELSRESAALWSRNVKWTDQGIVLPLSSDSDIVISLATPGDAPGLTIEATESSLHQYHKHIVDLLAPVLRILLSYNFRQVYRKRTAPPAPVTSRRPPRAVHPILQPLLERTQYQSIQHSIGDFVDSLTQVLNRAGFDVNLESPQDDMGLRDAIDRSKALKTSVIEQVVAKLCQTSATTHVLGIKQLNYALKVQFRSSPMGPEYRYEIVNVPEGSEIATLPRDMVLSDQAQFQDAIVHLIQLRLVEHIHSRLAPGKWVLDGLQTGDMHTVTGNAAATTSQESSSMTVSLLRKQLRVVYKGSSQSGRSWEISNTDEATTDIVQELVEADRNGQANGL